MKISSKELLLKSIIYRLCVIGGELLLASILIHIRLNDLFIFVVAVNAIKTLGYFIFDFGWFNYINKYIKYILEWFNE